MEKFIFSVSVKSLQVMQTIFLINVFTLLFPSAVTKTIHMNLKMVDDSVL